MTRVRQALGRSTATAPDESTRTASSPQGGLVRKLLLVVVLGIVVYLVTRRGDTRR